MLCVSIEVKSIKDDGIPSSIICICEKCNKKIVEKEIIRVDIIKGIVTICVKCNHCDNIATTKVSTNLLHITLIPEG